jgi:NAD-reducing hydrogenase large subunit
VGEDDLVTMCNLIVSTTNNNEPMNRAVTGVAKKVMSGQSTITEGMMNQVEVVIRAYDPCLSCATHAMGQMPLVIDLLDHAGNLLHRHVKGNESPAPSEEA